MVFDSGKCLKHLLSCLFLFEEKHFSFVCVQYAAGMAAASQTIIIRTALSYQDLYEVSHCCFHARLRLTDAVSV